MASGTEIKLIEPIVWHGKTLERLVVKAPRGQLYMRLGEPRFGVRHADGSQYWVEKDEVIAQYVAELLSVDGDKPLDGGDAVFAEMSLVDVLQVRDALFGFFTDARATILARSLITLSSGDASSQPMPAGA